MALAPGKSLHCYRDANPAQQKCCSEITPGRATGSGGVLAKGRRQESPVLLPFWGRPGIRKTLPFLRCSSLHLANSALLICLESQDLPFPSEFHLLAPTRDCQDLGHGHDLLRVLHGHLHDLRLTQQTSPWELQCRPGKQPCIQTALMLPQDLQQGKRGSNPTPSGAGRNFHWDEMKQHWAPQCTHNMMTGTAQ